MPRASRYLLEGYTYHLTHRCHDRRFLLKFAQELARLHAEGIEDLLAKRILRREPLWSESLAVGSQEYIERIKKDGWQRTRFDEECVRQDDQSHAWVVREAPDASVADSRSKSPLTPHMQPKT